MRALRRVAGVIETTKGPRELENDIRETVGMDVRAVSGRQSIPGVRQVRKVRKKTIG